VNDWKFIPTIMVATVLIFGAGVFTGGMLVDYVKQPHGKSFKRTAAVPTGTNAALAVATNSSSSNAPASKPAKVPEFLSKEFLQRLDADLKLTKEQHEAVKKIIEEGQNSVRKAVQDARLEIREALTPAQRQAFDDLVKRPFRHPLFGTNAPASGLFPEAQVILLEAQRAKAQGQPTNLLPPPALTNAP
jgi:Spy/CpxP family protein refolding chaperone